MRGLPQLGAGVTVSLFAAFAWAASLAVPHPVAPGDVPPPRIDFDQVEAMQAADRARAAHARQHPLSYEARVVGELVRRVGLREHEGNGPDVDVLRAELRKAALKAADRSELLTLRALQSELFMTAFDAHADTDGKTFGRELVELGGSFAAHAQRQGWWRAPLLRPERSELQAIYRIRWNDLAGLANDPAFRATANDRRLDFRLRLRGLRTLPQPDRGNAELAAITALARFDPTYPKAFASGIALIHAGAFKPAFDTLQAYLAATPNGHLALRARNFALYAALELSD